VESFKALKVPDFKTMKQLEPKEAPKLTKPVEFHFLTDARGIDKQAKS